jgi:hypothetical protein
MPLSSALALLSWITHACVRLSDFPKEADALERAFSSVDILSFCVSISLLSTEFRAVTAWIDWSFLSNSEVTRFISEEQSLKVNEAQQTAT